MKYYVVLRSERDAEEFYERFVGGVDVMAFRTIAHSILNGGHDKFYVEVGVSIGAIKDVLDKEDRRLVVTLDQYIALQARKTARDKIAAEEVVKVLFEEYSTGKFRNVFGSDYTFEKLKNEFTPAEIVSKIAAWKKKQDAKIKIGEDMIADALDEKYGIGKWTREEK